jgi:hypothetical protein
MRTTDLAKIIHTCQFVLEGETIDVFCVDDCNRRNFLGSYKREKIEKMLGAKR